MGKLTRAMLGALLGVVLAAGLFTAGAAIGAGAPALRAAGAKVLTPLLQVPLNASPETPAAATPAPSDRTTLFEPFWQAWDIVHKDFVDQPVNDETLMRGAIRGMLDSLGDTHTGYMDPQQYRQANLSLGGQYEGIGAWVDATGKYLTIVAPMPGSPAEKAGLRPGDVVIAVDGSDMTGIDGDLVVQHILGPKGTTVRLTIRREGEPKPLEFEVVRDSIIVPSVESRMLSGDIAYVRLYTFGDQTTRDLRAALQTLLKQNPRGLILDLRGNGGGYLNTAVEVASEFIPADQVILTERYGDGRSQVFRAKPGGLATKLPLVVLVNGGTASASEIVAGAIQDYGQGKLVGETTFGKGSVQDWVPLDRGQGAIRVTVARWYTPKGRQINDHGLMPDLAVALSLDDAKAGRDPQLDQALVTLGAAAGSGPTR